MASSSLRGLRSRSGPIRPNASRCDAFTPGGALRIACAQLSLVRSSVHSAPAFGASCKRHSKREAMALLDSSSAVARYTRLGIALHWLIAAALLAQVVLGSWMLGL